MTDKAHVIFYTKPGCHLCEEAREQIRQARCEELYTFEEIDIRRDPELLKRYGWEIPVVVINGTLAFKYQLTAADFKRAIKRLAKER